MASKEVATRETTDKPQPISQLPTVTPAVDIYENDEEILIVADFPGVQPEDVSVRLEAGQIDLEGKQATPTEQAESLPPVLFARSFRVPDTVDPSGISAELKNGVLSVHLKKSEASRPKRIKVKAA